MARIKVKINSAGARALLRSEEIQADLFARMGRIQDAANANIRDAPMDEMFQADVRVAASRARAMVKTSGFASMRENAKTNALLKALDRGR